MTSILQDHNFETVSAAGMVYLTLDNQIVFWQRFEQHIRVNVMYDKFATGGNYEKIVQNCLNSGKELAFPSSISSNTVQSDNRIVQETVCESSDGIKAFDNYVHTLLPVQFENQESKCESTEVLPSVNVLNREKRVARFETDPSDCKRKEAAMPVDCECIDGLEEDGEEEAHKMYTFRNEKDGVTSFQEHVNDFKGRKKKQFSERITRKMVKANKKRTKLDVADKCVDKKSRLSKSKKNDLTVKITLYNINKKSDRERHASARIKQKEEKDLDDSKRKPKVSRVKKLELEKDVKCEYCLEVFKSQQDYFDHRKGDRMSFSCKYCSKTLPFKAHLIVHMQKHNKNMISEAVSKDVENTRNDKKILKVTDSSTGTMIRKDGKGVTCDVCGLVVSNIPILKTHTMIHTEEYAYKCCVCGEKTHSIAKHNNHLATHLKGGKVQCKICNISFESRSELSKHQLTHEFKCSICDKVFPNKTSRVFHYKMAHREDILKCPTCGKLFSSEEELAPHMKYHRNRAKTQCTICGLFVTRLDNHMLSHNESFEEGSMFVCDKCPKKFKQKLSFQRHVRTHSEEKPYACMECPKRFARSGGLRRHMITHTHEKPFICEICGKACSQMGNLRIHMQIHKESVPVQCQVCGENFSYKNALQEHMRDTHYVSIATVESTKYLASVPQSLNQIHYFT